MTLPHTTGMITLTNGSTLITGTGTDWQTAGIVGGMVFPTAIGNVLPIAAVNSNTQMVAAVPWSGPTVSTQYALVRDTAYLQQLTENAALLTTVIRELRYSSLAALAALAPTMGADKLPFAASANAMAWAAFTAYGRALVAAANDKDFASAAKVVRRSGGTNMSATNDIMYGIETGTGLLIAQVDTTPFGRVWNDYYVTVQGGAADIRAKIAAFSTGGGSINGAVTINSTLKATSTIFAPYMALDTDGNNEASLSFQTSGVNRFNVFKSLAGGETGNNNGSNLAVNRWSDAGAYLGSPLRINRRYGFVETPDTPMCSCTPGSGAITLNAGQHHGWLNASGVFGFNRGGSGSAFIAGGSPGAGGTVVHIPVTGWYRVRATFVAIGAGNVLGVGRNGAAFVNAYVAASSWGSYAVEFMYYFAANDYLSILAVAGNTQISLDNTRLHIELVQQ